MRFGEFFDYDPDTGNLIWKLGRVRAGQIAGTRKVGNKGKPSERYYLCVAIAGRQFRAHRVVYEMMTGVPVPPGMEIDHKDGDSLNNRWANLRLATRSQNAGNRGRNKFRKYDLPKGVYWDNHGQRYVAYLAGRYVAHSRAPEIVKAAYDKAAISYLASSQRMIEANAPRPASVTKQARGD